MNKNLVTHFWNPIDSFWQWLCWFQLKNKLILLDQCLFGAFTINLDDLVILKNYLVNLVRMVWLGCTSSLETSVSVKLYQNWWNRFRESSHGYFFFQYLNKLTLKFLHFCNVKFEVLVTRKIQPWLVKPGTNHSQITWKKNLYENLNYLKQT